MTNNRRVNAFFRENDVRLEFVFTRSSCPGSTADNDTFAEFGVFPALTGGFEFPAPPLGLLRSKNITPDRETRIGRYSDPQIARMLRYAVRSDGQASVLPLMP
jgi:hypothetical protein